MQTLQIRAHTQRQQLMDVVHDKGEHYPFDFFFEETSKNRYIADVTKDIPHQDIEESETDDDDSEKDD